MNSRAFRFIRFTKKIIQTLIHSAIRYVFVVRMINGCSLYIVYIRRVVSVKYTLCVSYTFIFGEKLKGAFLL